MPFPRRGDGSRIGVSLLAYSPWRTGGIGTFTVGVARTLAARDNARDYVFFAPSIHESHWRDVLGPRATIVACGPDPSYRPLRVLFEQFRLPPFAADLGVQLLFFPIAIAPVVRAVRTVVTVPDVLAISKRSTDMPWYKIAYLHWTYRRLAQTADRIVTISEFSRREIHAELEIPAERVTVVPVGVDPDFIAPPFQSPRVLKDRPARYVLSIAGAYPHKRLGMLLEAFESIADDMPDVHLVLAGTHTGKREAVARLRQQAALSRYNTRIRFVPPSSRGDIAVLLSRAAALVSSSEFEGFGIPVLEAMAARCPVAAAPAEAVLELLGGYGWIAEDFSPSALAQILREVLSVPARDDSRVEMARLRALTMYSWSRVAVALEAVFANALSARR